MIYEDDAKIILKQDCDWANLRNKTILISGATGLLGSVLTDMFSLLNEKFSLNLKLLLISRNPSLVSAVPFINYIAHDINLSLNNINFENKIDYIIHLASNTHPLLYASDPIKTITTNIFGTYNLLELAAKNPGCRFLLASSVEIYGEDKNVSENGYSEKDAGYIDSNSLRSGYPESKRLSESLCQAYKAEKNVDFVIARLSRCYGPTLRKDDSKVMSQFLKNAVEKKDIVLKSEGNQKFSYLYSADTASAIIFLLLNGKCAEAYNVADRKSEIQIRKLAELIAKISGVKVVKGYPESLEKKGYSVVQNAVLNPAKINQLGWKASFSIEEGIEITLKCMK